MAASVTRTVTVSFLKPLLYYFGLARYLKRTGYTYIFRGTAAHRIPAGGRASFRRASNTQGPTEAAVLPALSFTVIRYSGSMRSLGLPELIVIAGIVMLLFGGKRLSELLGSLGKRTKQAADQARWIYQSLGGTQEEEIEAEAPVGRRLAGEFLNQFPKDDDPVAQRRVEQVGQRLVEAAGEKREFTFRVVRAEIANAFALPGGHIFITRPLLDLCAGDDDQLAYLLGHEMSHVIRRHSAERFVTKAVLSALPVRGAIAELLDKGYSRDQELEADTGDRKSTRLNSSHIPLARMPSSA